MAQEKLIGNKNFEDCMGESFWVCSSNKLLDYKLT